MHTLSNLRPVSRQAPASYTGAAIRPSYHVRSLRASFTWTFAGNVVYSACQWGILVLLAKLGSPEMVGQYALAMAIAAPVIVFAQLQLRTVLTTDVEERYSFREYARFRSTMMCAAVATIAAIALSLQYSWESRMLMLVVGLGQAIEGLSDIFYALLQLRDRMDCIAVSLATRGPLALIAMGALVYATGSVLWGAVGMTLARLLVLLAYDLPSSKRVLRESHHPRNGWAATERRESLGSVYRGLLHLGFWLGLLSLLVSLNSNIPRYFIEASLGKRELGLFSALAFLLSSGNLVVGALGQSAFVRLARFHASGDLRKFSGLLLKLLGVGTVLGLGGVLVALLGGRELLTLLYRREYAERADLLVWMMAAAGVGYLAQFIGYATTAARFFKRQIPLFALAALAVALASYRLIPTHGLTGGVVALLIGAFVQLIGSALLLAYSILPCFGPQQPAGDLAS